MRPTGVDGKTHVDVEDEGGGDVADEDHGYGTAQDN